MNILEKFFQGKKLSEFSIDEQKKYLRQQLTARREEMFKTASPQNWGPRQFQRALELLNIKNIRDLENKYQIACFFPIRGELNFLPFAKEKWLFPKIQNTKELGWFEYGDGKTNYITNKYGIPEKEDLSCISYNQSSLPMLCFLPGLAASQNGNRLGYGGGYYDKFLHKYKNQVTSVLCLPSRDFLFDALPCDTWDEKVDLIVF